MIIKIGMKILHTSDWHLGRSLYGYKLYFEHEAFLEWTANIIEVEKIEVLLIAGDVFDTTAPSNKAQELYYRFLLSAMKSGCSHVVIVAGNHDSPSFLQAPSRLLSSMNIHVVASVEDNLHNEVLLLKDKQGAPQLIVCAVPYLRDKEIRIFEPGERFEDKERKLVQGIAEHYDTVSKRAEMIRKEIGEDIPIIATGHLFAAGGKTVEGDGVRDLYIGSLGAVPVESFPDCLDYVALGHLHSSQIVAGLPHVRYSGSPLPMNFQDAARKKSVCIVNIISRNQEPAVDILEVPSFLTLEQIKGNWEYIEQRLITLKRDNSKILLEVVFQGEDFIADLPTRVESLVDGSQLKILSVKNMKVLGNQSEAFAEEESLDTLSVEDVFERLLETQEITQEKKDELRSAYREITTSLYEEDFRAE